MLERINALELPEGSIPEEFEHYLKWIEHSESAKKELKYLLPILAFVTPLSVHLLRLVLSFKSAPALDTLYIVGGIVGLVFSLISSIHIWDSLSAVKGATRYARWIGQAASYVKPIIDQIDRYEEQVELLQKFFQVKEARNSVLGLLNSQEFDVRVQLKIDKLAMERADILQKLSIAGALVNVHDDSFDGLSEIFFDNEPTGQVTAETIAHVSASVLPVEAEAEVRGGVEISAHEEQIPGVISLAAERAKRRKEA